MLSCFITSSGERPGPGGVLLLWMWSPGVDAKHMDAPTSYSSCEHTAEEDGPAL